MIRRVYIKGTVACCFPGFIEILKNYSSVDELKSSDNTCIAILKCIDKITKIMNSAICDDYSPQQKILVNLFTEP